MERDSFEVLQETVIAPGLCLRCGACMGVCPLGSVVPDARAYPVQSGRCTSCGLCLAACPGKEVDFPGLERLIFGGSYDPATLHGTHRNLYLGWAADGAIRSAGASGGVITGLLAHLVRAGRIGGAIVCAPDPAIPYGSAAVLASDEGTLRRGAQSRLTFIPVLRLLKELPPGPLPWAVVALPCQVHALRKLEQAAPALVARVGLIVGLYCHFNLELDAVTDLLRLHHIDPRDVARVEYRGGDWPGSIRAVFPDGRARPLHRVGYKEAVTVLLRLYSPLRCHLCIDPSNEFADLAVGDVWAKDYSGEWAVEKSSLITQRTERGGRALEEARRAGALVLKELPPEKFSRRHLSFFREKKENAFVRIARRARRGAPVPAYGFGPPPIGLGRRMRERILNVSFLAGRRPRLRRALLRLYLSPAGLLLAGLNNLRKYLAKDFKHD